MDIIDTAAEIEELQHNAAVPGCQTCAECQGVIELKNKQRGM
ncbi:hypothetical protein VBL71_04825 [Enterobacter hormaechei]|nr:hypothetical protein [Enterobacter hormaechei]